MSIILFLFVAGCQQPASEPETTPSAPVQQTQTTPAPAAPPVTTPQTCEEWATELVPEFITVHEGVGACERSLKGTWTDDSPVKLIGRNIEFTNNQNRKFMIAQGKEIGEDPSRYYVRAFNGEIANLGYLQEVRNSAGVLIGYDKFTVNANGYERMDISIKESDGIGCYYYDYLVNDFTITECEKASQ